MIVWINGPFGAGKTTVARALREQVAGALLFDPEHVGFLLWQSVPREGDFQDLPLWRRLVIETAHGLTAEYGVPVIAPMSLIVPAYRAEILDGLRSRGTKVTQVVLDVPEAALRARIDADTVETGARGWRQRYAERALREFDGVEHREADTIRVDNSSADPATVARHIAERLALTSAAD